MSNMNLIIFGFEKDAKIVEILKEQYSEAYDVYESDDHEGISQSIAVMDNAVFIFNVSDKSQLQKSIFVIKSARKLQHNNLFKTFCCLTYEFQKNQKILKSYGVLDFFTPDEKPAQVTHKLDVMAGKLKTKLTEVKSYEDYAKKVKETTLSNEELLKDKLSHTEALDLASDIWIMKSKQEVNFVLRKWVVEIFGPSTHIGKWGEVVNEENENKQLWRYNLVDGADPEFITDDGFWYFEGDKPIFDWKKKRWIFSADEPRLFFEKNDEDKTRFFKIDFIDGVITFAKNSEHAKLKENMIDIAASISLDLKGIAKAREEYKGLRGKLEAKKQNEDEFSKLVGETSGGVDQFQSTVKSKSNYKENLDDQKFIIKEKDRNLGGALSGKGGTDNLGSNSYSGTIAGDGPFSEDHIIVRDLNLESGEVTVDLMYDPDRDDFNLQCEFEDIFENELVVLVPKNSVLLNENVTAEVVLRYNGEEANITCRGRIIEIEPLEEDKETLIIDLTKMSREKYMKFMELFKERQENIVDFMVRAKGH